MNDETRRSGMIIPIVNPQRMSVGRCTTVMTLQVDMMMATMMRKYPIRIRFLFLVLYPRRSVAMAMDMETAAWSDGKELEGRNLCRRVSSASRWNNSMLGLSFRKNAWMQMFVRMLIKHEKKMKRAPSLRSSCFLIIPLV